jgi:7,8-dihydropterin-6-yl-methyl-4-(beta-D-ribofuranosyl)aminobenzene 5'-phosphate synthase
MTQHITISILCEDQANMGFRDKKFLAQHGFSIFIEAEKRILFDTGASDVFMHNAAMLDIDTQTADWIVLSHGHWDHTDGLEALATREKKNLLAHPGVFVDRRKPTGAYNGMSCTRQEIDRRFNLILSNEPYRIGDAIYFLGEIPRLNDFEARQTPFFHVVDKQRHEDFIMDDSALAIDTEKGLVIVTGCSHAGICNIVEHARHVTGRRHVHAVLGGFHLMGDSIQLRKTINYFKANAVDHLFPMHCTALTALAEFHNAFGIEKLCAGDTLSFDR